MYKGFGKSLFRSELTKLFSNSPRRALLNVGRCLDNGDTLAEAYVLLVGEHLVDEREDLVFDAADGFLLETVGVDRRHEVVLATGLDVTCRMCRREGCHSRAQDQRFPQHLRFYIYIYI